VVRDSCHNQVVPRFGGTTGVAIMEPFDVFTVRDLRQRSGDLLRDAEEGRLSLITKHGRPAILAVPFDERLLSHGIHRALALHLFEAGQVTLAQGAKLAGLSLEDFIELVSQTGIAAVSYPPEDLEDEVEAAR
jgi:prevent-host-death family protein